MGSISKERLFSATVQAAEQRAEEMRRAVDKAACEAWNLRMEGYGGTAQPPPLLSDRQSARLALRNSQVQARQVVDQYPTYFVSVLQELLI